MTITSDWHIHSRNSCDGACMTVADLVADTAQSGVRDIGISDHLHTPFNLPDVAASRREFLESNPSPRFHFGIEVSCMSQWEIDEVATGRHENPVYGLRQGGPPAAPLAIGLAAEDIDEYGIEYVIGGTHWPMYVPLEREAVIRDYHRQNMFLACHPLVDIVAHPWWWMGHWAGADGCFAGDPWFDDFRKIPESMHREFAAAVIESDALVEINLHAMLLNPNYPDGFKAQYMEYLAGLKSLGVRFSMGSDCHSQHYGPDLETASRMIDSAGIDDTDLWVQPPRRP